jgi:exportin-5
MYVCTLPPIIWLVLTLSSHRAAKVDPEARMQKLQSFITPVKQLWQNSEMNEAISSFDGFCELLGLGKVRDYLVSRHVHEIQEWGLYQLDEEGQAIQKELDDRVKV